MSNPHIWNSPTARSRFVVIERSTEKLTIEFTDEPGNIGPPRHFHPAQEERFTVLEGELTLEVGGRAIRLAAGESHLISKGLAHTLYNAGASPVRFTSEHVPPLGFESFLKTIYDIDADGRANARGQPSFLQTMVLLRAHPNGQFLAGPPRLAQRAMVAVVGALGKLLGYPPEYRSARRELREEGARSQPD